MQESHRKASIICPESDIEALGGCQGSTPEQLSAQLTRLNQRFQRESERYICDMFSSILSWIKMKCSLKCESFLCRYTESIDDLRMLYEKKERKILRKQQTYKAFREKLNVSFIFLAVSEKQDIFCALEITCFNLIFRYIYLFSWSNFLEQKAWHGSSCWWCMLMYLMILIVGYWFVLLALIVHNFHCDSSC